MHEHDHRSKLYHVSIFIVLSPDAMNTIFSQGMLYKLAIASNAYKVSRTSLVVILDLYTDSH